jgi:hypothetical protein
MLGQWWLTGIWCICHFWTKPLLLDTTKKNSLVPRPLGEARSKSLRDVELWVKTWILRFLSVAFLSHGCTPKSLSFSKKTWLNFGKPPSQRFLKVIGDSTPPPMGYGLLVTGWQPWGPNEDWSGTS